MATFSHSRRRFSIGLISSLITPLVGCSAPPVVVSVHDLIQRTPDEAFQVAAVAAWDSDTHIRLYNTVLLTADAPPLHSVNSLPMTIGTYDLTRAPWRDTATLRYLPAIIDIDSTAPQTTPVLTGLHTDISEHRIGNHPLQRLIRLTGILREEGGQIRLVDQYDSRRVVSLQPSPELQLVSTRLPVFVEGVAVATTMFALVIAPISTHTS
jgi:hypothetical protein